MFINDNIMIIIPVILTFIGIIATFIGYRYNHRLAIKRSKRDEIIKAKEKFWNAVNIDRLETLDITSFYSAIVNVSQEQDMAAREFSNILPEKDRICFDAKWKEYREHRHHRPMDPIGLDEKLKNVQHFINSL